MTATIQSSQLSRLSAHFGARSNARASDVRILSKRSPSLTAGQGTGVYLFVNLSAVNQPILRQFCDGYVRCRMRLQILDSHSRNPQDVWKHRLCQPQRV